MSIDLVEYLDRKGIPHFQAAGPELTIHCPWCPDGNPKYKGKCYVNTADAVFYCQRCQETGTWHKLVRQFGDDPDQLTGTPDGPDPHTRQQVLTDALRYAVEQLANNEPVLRWLMRERGLDPETIVDAKLGWISRSWPLTPHLRERGHSLADIRAAGLLDSRDRDLFADHLVIAYRSRSAVMQLRAKAMGGKYLTGAGEAVRLFDVDQLTGPNGPRDRVLITEGELDALIVGQHLARSPDPALRDLGVVALPGASAFPKEWADYFRHTKRVYLGLDPDDAGRKGAEKIQAALGAKARVVQLPATSPKCDWTELLTNRGGTWREVRELLANCGGRRLFSVADAAAAWRKQRATTTGVKFGYATIDAAILPGVLPGQLVVALAKTGVGKTVWLCNLAYAMRERRVLFVSLEMTRAEVYTRLARIYRFWHPLASDDDIDRAYANLAICDENRLDAAVLADLVTEYTEEYGTPPELVFVDYLGYFARAITGVGAYDKTSNAVMELKAFAKSADLIVLTPAQVNRMTKDGKPVESDAARDSGVIEETADFLFSLYRPDDAVNEELAPEDRTPSAKVKLEILKSRHGGKGTVATLTFSAASLVLVDAGTAAARRAEAESHQIWQGATYEEVAAAERRRFLAAGHHQPTLQHTQQPLTLVQGGAS